MTHQHPIPSLFHCLVVACAGLLPAAPAFAAEPAMQAVNRLANPGETVTVEWTGTVQPGVDQSASVDVETTCSGTFPGGDTDIHQLVIGAATNAAEGIEIGAVFSIDWSGNQDIDFAVRRDGELIGSSANLIFTSSERVGISDARTGTYDIASCSGAVTASTPYRGKVTLTAYLEAELAPVTPPPSPGAPRYQQQQSPVGIGDSMSGEMSVGFNPSTGRYLLLHWLQTMRMTPAEDLVDTLETPMKLPENCAAQWEDVSYAPTSLTSVDPILSTDPQTGRTFVSQLVGSPDGSSIYAYSDDDGEQWTQGTLSSSGAFDHQSLVSGPYVAGQGPLPTATGYPNVVIYCSNQLVYIACTRSDDGGLTFLAPVVAATPADCDGVLDPIHGHIRFAPDGTIYVPVLECGDRQAVLVSTDSGRSYEIRINPNATRAEGQVHAAIAPSLDGSALYHCYVNGLGEARVSVSRDQGLTWPVDTSVGAAQGIQQAMFPAAVAGDADRATCGFVATKTHGNYQAFDFPGVWHVYMATTYNGGQSWRTVLVTPDNPVQGAGGICNLGALCGTANQHRNLLDFNEMVMDTRGYPLYAYDDGCVGPCDKSPVEAPTYVAKAAFARQVGGRGLIAAHDPVEPAAPHRTCLTGARLRPGSTLTWPVPDSSGSAVTGYRIYRGTTLENFSEIAKVGAVNTFADTSADPALPYYYKVSAINAIGEAPKSNAVLLPPNDMLPVVESSCALPGLRVAEDAEGDSFTGLAAHDILDVSVAEPVDLPGKIAITFRVADLATLPPGSLWVFRFRSPANAEGTAYWFVGMHTASGTPSFVHGVVDSAVPGTATPGVFTIAGNIDAASRYDADGTITLIAYKALFGFTDGDLMSAVAASVRPISNSMAAATVRNFDDMPVDGTPYSLTGNVPCKAATPPIVVPVDPTPTPSLPPAQERIPVVADAPVAGNRANNTGRFGGAVNPLLVLILLVGVAGRSCRRK